MYPLRILCDGRASAEGYALRVLKLKPAPKKKKLAACLSYIDFQHGFKYIQGDSIIQMWYTIKIILIPGSKVGDGSERNPETWLEKVEQRLLEGCITLHVYEANLQVSSPWPVPMIFIQYIYI